MFKYDLIDFPEPKVATTSNGRFYDFGGDNYFPSVTTVLGDHGKEGLTAWRERVGYEEAARIGNLAASRGQKVHAIVEAYMKGEEPDIKMPSNAFAFKQLQPILDGYINNIRAQEAPLYSDYLKVGGRVDCVADWDGTIAIIDFKTSLRPKIKEWIDGYFMQASAYSVMFEERTGIAVSKLVLLIYNDESKPQVFIENRDNWIVKFMEERVKFRENHNV